MDLPPSAQIEYWREQPPEKRDRDAIRAFTHELGLPLKKQCLLYQALLALPGLSVMTSQCRIAFM